VTQVLAVAQVHTAIADQLRTSFASSWNVSAWPVDRPHAPQMQLMLDDPWVEPGGAYARGKVQVNLTLQLIVATSPIDEGLELLADVLSVYPVGHASRASTVWGVLDVNKAAICAAGGFSDLVAVRPVSIGSAQDGEVRLLIASVPLTALGQVVA
jgi:hypothetical protein